MAEYIDREALLAHIRDLPTWWADDGGYFGGAQKLPDGLFDPNDIISSIENAPAADVAPVEHGRWGDNGIPGSILSGCSVCGFTCGASSFSYCPYCGAELNPCESENSYYDWCCEYCEMTCDKRDGWCERFCPVRSKLREEEK